jgi:hypothetical protein
MVALLDLRHLLLRLLERDAARRGQRLGSLLPRFIGSRFVSGDQGPMASSGLVSATTGAAASTAVCPRAADGASMR